MSGQFNRTSMIKVRGCYSDRNGYNLVCNSIQVDDIDDRTRVILSNKIGEICYDVFSFSRDFNLSLNFDNEGQENFLKAILSEVFNETNFLENHINNSNVFKKLDSVCKQAPINEIFDLVEFICDYICTFYKRLNRKRDINAIYKSFNALFEKECIGYRFVNGKIIKNIDKTEIVTIEESGKTKFDGCNSHIQKATHYLYDRENTDYKNSIKESISAVESICKIIAGNGATLGDALKVLEKKHSLNKLLKAAFEKLYSYTNSEGGIRHAEGMFESEVTFEEAKFMLVSCCAFVNYLIAEYGKIEG